jgi:colanic acid biosynthesis glycosyl transferase WcaI
MIAAALPVVMQSYERTSMRKPGKIVVVSQHYLPDRSATAAIMSAIAGHLATKAPVLVLSGTPGSKSHESVSSSEPTVVETKNRMPGKAALFKRAIAQGCSTLSAESEMQQCLTI